MTFQMKIILENDIFGKRLNQKHLFENNRKMSEM